ncbi:MAG: efflux RND transporter periplasmic adaptor subunit [Nitrospirae bacterium]|nr:efflux RND transporter periplasmic adaptor subunit [Nitrospirota bacterium]
MKKAGVLVVLFVSILAVSGCNNHGQEIRKVERGTIRKTVVATGRVEGWRMADVSARVPGRIETYLKAEGDSVEEAEPVVLLERADFMARLKEALAGEKLARLTLERTRALRSRGDVPQEALDEAEAAFERATAQRELAESSLADHVVRAPFSGKILKTYFETGEAISGVGPSAPLFRLADLGRLKIVAEVDETDAGTVRDGQKAVVTSDAFRGETFEGVVRQVASAAGRKKALSDDPREKLDAKVVETEIEILSPTELKPGMTAQARIVTLEREGVLIVSAAAVDTGREDPFVSVRVGGKDPVRRAVRLGERGDGQVEVLEGLSEGEEILVPRR